MDAPPDSIFHPCGHGGLCFDCAKTIIETNATCHYCRKVRIIEINKILILNFQDVEKVIRIDTHKKYKDIYRVKEVFRVASVESSMKDENEDLDDDQVSGIEV